MFADETYIVLEVPPPTAEEVMAVRTRNRDWFRRSLPVEITVAGSSGVGVIAPGQDPHEVFARLDAVAAKTAPFQAEFGAVLRFPDSDIFVLTLVDEAPFQALHLRIANSGIRFMSARHPYKPHCTLRSRSPVTEAEADELLSLRLPGSFTLDTLSVYRLDRLPMTLPHRARLTGSVPLANKSTVFPQENP